MDRLTSYRAGHFEGLWGGVRPSMLPCPACHHHQRMPVWHAAYLSCHLSYASLTSHTMSNASPASTYSSISDISLCPHLKRLLPLYLNCCALWTALSCQPSKCADIASHVRIIRLTYMLLAAAFKGELVSWLCMMSWPTWNHVCTNLVLPNPTLQVLLYKGSEWGSSWANVLSAE